MTSNVRTESTREWTVRRATLEDRDEVLGLLRRSFADSATGGDRWDWIFARGPMKSRLHYLVAEARGEIVGQYAAMPVLMQHDGRRIGGLISVETATDPRFERQGILTTLARHLYEEASTEAGLVYGFPNHKSAPVLFNKLGWVELRPLPLLARPLGNLASILGENRAVLRPLARVVDAALPLMLLAGRADAALGRLRGAEIVSFDEFGPWADELWSSVADRLGTCTVRDAAFLEWRFRRSPVSYRMHGLQRHGRLMGFAVSRVREWKGTRLAHLMELLVRPDDAVGARSLLADVILRAAEDGAVALHALVGRRHPHRDEMYRAGIVPMPGRPRSNYSFGVKINGPAATPNQALHHDDWYISGSDTDFY